MNPFFIFPSSHKSLLQYIIQLLHKIREREREVVNMKEEGRPIFDCGHKVLLLEIKLKGERSIFGLM